MNICKLHLLTFLFFCLIVPDVLACFPKNSRMLRLFRLLKLDKYVPSISLVDDVVRLKRSSLIISCFAAATLWILFSGLMYLAEYKDNSMEIDNLPLYGCIESCHMSDRYANFFKSFPLTGIHLTGDL